MVIYESIQLVGTSEESFSDAVKNLYNRAKATIRRIRNIEILMRDVKVKQDSDKLIYRIRAKVTFEYQPEEENKTAPIKTEESKKAAPKKEAEEGGVSKNLLRELKEKMDAGVDAAGPEDVLRVYEFFKQVAATNDDLKDELADMDITVQQVITDVGKKFWIKAKDGTIEYGEGDADSPSFTFSCTMKTGAGMLFGEVDATSAYMAGDITVEGNLQDAMAFQEIIELAMEAFEDLAEDL